MSRSRRNRRSRTRPPGDRAIIYVRVSTNNQVYGNSLDSQVDRCREFCEREGMTVVQVFREEGESAKTANRTQLQALLKYCSPTRGNNISWLVVYDVSRFSRDNADHLALRNRLANDGVLLRSVTQQFDESPNGEFMEGLASLQAQLDNRLRAQTTRHNMEKAVASGRWLWGKPLGYKSGPTNPDGPSLLVDPDVAPLVRRAFEEMASGLRTKREVLDEVTALGLLTRRNKALSATAFGEMLRNPIYAGRIRCAFQDDGPGDFEAIVDLDLFEAVQAVLDGRKPSTTKRRRDHPDFPLRRIIRCSACGGPLTASWSTSRSGAKYGYYFCFTKGCREVKVPKAQLEDLFTRLLADLSIRPEVFRLLAAVVEDTWRDTQREADTARRRLSTKIEEVEHRRDRLVDAYLDGSIDQGTYNSAKHRMERDLDDMRQNLDHQQLAAIDLDTTLAYAESMLVDLPDCWNRLEPQHRPDFVRAICPDDLSYHDGAIRTARNPWWAKGFAASDGPNDDWVPPTGFEPVLPA